ncbi:hypothetical protein IJ670_06635 [bacterium]|nr:hypothetical protein [bacterium]
MTDVNTIMVVSNKNDFISQVSQKLVLLRNLDKIKSTSFQDALDTMEESYPNTIIVHCDNNKPDANDFIKQVKSKEKFSNIPILFINENCTREMVIEAYDLGISDILFMPIIDYELIIRTLWCLRQNEANLKVESRKNFMSQIGLSTEGSGVYSKEYCDEFLKSEIIQTHKYSAHACILLMSADKENNSPTKNKDLISVIQKSIRLNDTIIEKDEGEYYIYLQKTKLNGAYSVFERIINQAGELGVSAGVVEVLSDDFDEIKLALEKASQKAKENINSLIVASGFWADEEKPKLSLETPKDYNARKTQEIIQEKQEAHKNATTTSQTAKSPGNVKLFHQMYTKKLNVVIAPVFKKYEANVKIKHPTMTSEAKIGRVSYFKLSKDSLSAIFLIEYDGYDSVNLNIDIIDEGQKRLSETEKIDFTVLNYQKVSLMLSELIDEFVSIANSGN